MNIVLVIVHVVISVALIATVLMQHGKQQGLSGAIAGGAETFFGKNKGRTIDAVLKKVTAVLAVLFVVSSLILTASAVKQSKPEETPVQEEVVTDENAGTQVEASLDENGNLVDAEGNEVKNKKAEEYFMGQLLVIKGTEVSFYVPPTGIEVIPLGGKGGDYARDAVTLERLEYAILKDEDGVCGLLCLNKETDELVAFETGNIVLATGGPAGIYADNV